MSFITTIVSNTRNHKSIYLGASPRASIGILNGAKAMAAMQGRDFVTPEDIIYVAPQYCVIVSCSRLKKKWKERNG